TVFVLLTAVFLMLIDWALLHYDYLGICAETANSYNVADLMLHTSPCDCHGVSSEKFKFQGSHNDVVVFVRMPICEPSSRFLLSLVNIPSSFSSKGPRGAVVLRSCLRFLARQMSERLIWGCRLAPF
ncbi:unnamed protein product, partial [Ilex paraguariensis]